MPRLPLLLSTLSLLPLLAGPFARADRLYTKRVAKGVTLKQSIREAPNPPRIMSVVTADLKQPGLNVTAELGQDDVENDGRTNGREAVSTFARRRGATVAVNSDYLIGGAPVGLMIHNGELITLPYMHRVVCALLPGNRVVFDIPQTTGTVKILRSDGSVSQSFPLTSMNRGRGANALLLYTPTYGPKTLTNASGTEVVLTGMRIPLRPGSFSATVEEVRVGQGKTPLRSDTVVLSGNGTASAFLKTLQPGDLMRIGLSVRSPQIPDWGVVREAFGGGPYLVRGGKVFIDAKAQKFQPDVVLGRSPRTAVGRTRDGKLVIVAVDGRQPMSPGATLSEMAELMAGLGCETAINLDGGGSTAMAVHGLRVNSPSDGWERSVASMLAVRAPALSHSEITAIAAVNSPDPGVWPFHLIAELDGPLSSGQSVAFELKDENGETLPAGLPIIWGVEGPIGFVDQAGIFTAGKRGSGRVVARWGSETAAAEIEVVPSMTPASIVAKWSPPDPVRPQSSVLTVTVADANGNRIRGLRVGLVLPEGGSADALSKPTDENGIASLEVVWPGNAPRQVTVKAGNLSTVTPVAFTLPPQPVVRPE